jgi:ribosomal protein L35
MKTNKSYTKRIRVTKNGKLVVRVKGQNHFNAKASGSKRSQKRRQMTIALTTRARRRFLPGAAKAQSKDVTAKI